MRCDNCSCQCRDEMDSINEAFRVKSMFVALLRGINVSGKRTIHMADLRTSLQAMGCQAVRTYLQSGNVVFEAEEIGAEVLAIRIKAMILADFGHEVEVLVLGVEAFREIIVANPLSPAGAEEGKLFHATLLFEPVSKAAFDRLAMPQQGQERVVLIGKTVFLHCPHGYSKTKLNNSFFEKKLLVPATTRNWRSMLAILDLCV